MKDEAVTREDRVASLKGMGCSRKRVEDARFTQGKGNYVDDIKLDGMLFGDFVRSPYAHAKITNIDTPSTNLLASGTSWSSGASLSSKYIMRMMRK